MLITTQVEIEGPALEDAVITSSGGKRFGQPEFLRALRPVIALGSAGGWTPADLTLAVLAGWFNRAIPSLTCLAVSPDALSSEPQIVRLCEALARLPLLEAGHWIGSAYAKFIDAHERRALSMYFTPPTLAACALDQLEREGVLFDENAFLDPACGGAAFLVPIAIRMREALRNSAKPPIEILRHVESYLRGFELDGTLCTLSRELLRAVLHQEISLCGVEPTFSIVHGNALDHSESLQGTCDVVVCNPPYRKMGREERADLPEEIAALMTHQPNLYGVFIAISVRCLRDGGVCALVTPTSFLSGRSFASLRNWMSAHVRTRSIGIVDARLGVFLDVQQETSITVCRKASSAGVASHVRVHSIGKDGTQNDIGHCALGPGPLAWSIPRRADDVALVNAGARLRSRIENYGYQVRIGSFVWNRDPRTTYPSWAAAQRTKGHVVPLLWASDIKPGKKLSFDGAAKATGERRLVAIDDLYAPSVIRSPSVMLQRVTSNDQPRRLVAGVVPLAFIRQHGAFLAENHTVILTPKVPRPSLSVVQMANLLCCDRIDRLFRCLSGSTNVSAFELAQLPLPCPIALRTELDLGLSMEDAVDRLMDLDA